MRLNGLLGSSRMVSDSELKVVVLGLGYIGLLTAAVIARTGAQVLGIDVSEHVVETVNSGKVHIEAVDLDGLVSGVVARGHLRAATQIEPADVFGIDRKSVGEGKRVTCRCDLGVGRVLKT